MKHRIAKPSTLLLTALLVAALGVFGLAGPAQAQTRTVQDGSGPHQQGPAYRLSKGTFKYSAERTVLKAHLQRVVKKRTWVGAHVYYRGGSLWLRTFHRRNGTKVVSARYSGEHKDIRLRANARWNYQRHTVTFVINNAKQDPRPGNRKAAFDLYTVTKGWQHGPACSPMPHLRARSHATAGAARLVPDGPPTVAADDCNDDYVFTRLRR